MVQMSTERIFADGYGMSIIGISRRYVADIHFGLSRCCARYKEPRNSEITMGEKKRSSNGNHIFLLIECMRTIANQANKSIACLLWAVGRCWRAGQEVCSNCGISSRATPGCRWIESIDGVGVNLTPGLLLVLCPLAAKSIFTGF